MTIVAIIAQGMLGAGIARRLTANGAMVLASLAGRSGAIGALRRVLARMP
jgi:predicted dinucleotide-binding enzyme